MPRNDADWRRFRANISHTRLIQSQQLKLFQVHIYDRLKQRHVALPSLTLMYDNPAQQTDNLSESPACLETLEIHPNEIEVRD